MNDIKDVKPPIDMLDLWWIWLVLIALILLLIGYFIYARRNKNPIHQPVVVPTMPAWEVALNRLKQLEAKDYAKQAMFKEFYIELSFIVRKYLEEQLSINAPEMTTEEFLNFAKTSPALNSVHKQILKDFLSGCDMVKFAKHVPDIKDAQSNLDLARNLIMETKNGI